MESPRCEHGSLLPPHKIAFVLPLAAPANGFCPPKPGLLLQYPLPRKPQAPSGSSPAPKSVLELLLGTGTVLNAVCQTPTGPGTARDAASFLGKGRGAGSGAGWLRAACPWHSGVLGAVSPAAGDKSIINTRAKPLPCRARLGVCATDGKVASGRRVRLGSLAWGARQVLSTPGLG